MFQKLCNNDFLPVTYDIKIFLNHIGLLLCTIILLVEILNRLDNILFCF